MTDTDSKWRRLLVVGEPVTPEQADEILVRTTCLYRLYCNDEVWMHTLQDAFGLHRNDLGYATSESVRAAVADLGMLDLMTLTTYRVYSVWIDGPRGWCDWTGRIGCTSYNLGEHPDVAAITGEWAQIAAAFPYLDLRAQLLADEGTGPVVAQWRVAEGRATPEPPGPRIAEPTEPDPAAVYRRLLAGGERGVPLPRLRTAIDRVRTAAEGIADTADTADTDDYEYRPHRPCDDCGCCTTGDCASRACAGDDEFGRPGVCPCTED